MSDPKVIVLKTDEELLKELEQSTGTEGLTEESSVSEQFYINDVHRFLIELAITSGENAIPLKSIFKLFRLWNKSKIRKFNIFLKALRLVLPLNEEEEKVFVNKNGLTIASQYAKLFSEIHKKPDNTTELIRDKKQFESFLQDTNLTSGSILVEDFVLYDAYRTWAQQTKAKRRLSDKRLTGLVKLYFEFQEKFHAPIQFFVNRTDIVPYDRYITLFNNYKKTSNEIAKKEKSKTKRKISKS